LTDLANHKYRMFLSRNNHQLWLYLAKRQLSSKFSHTSVFMQTGLKIRELPMVVQKVNDVLKIKELNQIGNGSKLSESCDVADIAVTHTVTLPSANDREIMEGFNRIVSVSGLFKLLETLPAQKVTPTVAVHCLKRIIHLNNTRRRNNFEIDARLPSISMDENGGSFLRFAFINMLLDIVYRSKDPRVILDGLRVVCQDTDFTDSVASDISLKSIQPQSTVKYKERMYEETLVLITGGVFSLTQICEAVLILSKFYPNDKKRSIEMTDSLWTGILSKDLELCDPKSVVAVFRTLPCLNQSRDLVYKLVSEKACDMWQEFTTKDIMEILRVLNIMGQIQCNYCQASTLSMISQWSLVNVHNLKEQELLALVVCMDKMEFYNKLFIDTMEKYMKARGVNIKEADLVAAACDYCDHQKVRSAIILEASAEYFVEHSKILNTPQINSIAKVFGNLNIHPSSGFKFWDKLETLLEQKFAEFPPKDLIQLMLSFIYIEKFPVNLAHKIFNPNFVDRIETCKNSADVWKSKSGMDILLASLKLETAFSVSRSGYMTVNMYKDSTDRKIFRIHRDILQALGSIIGDVKRIGMSVDVPGMCKNSLYTADLLILPSDLLIYASVAESMLKLGRIATKNQHLTAVLIHTPEHYERNQVCLLGHQAMRERQLKKLGYKVMHVNYSEVNKLLVVPSRLSDYLKSKYDEALKS